MKSITFIFVALISIRAQGVTVMVNDFYQGTGTVSGSTKMASDEYIEFVITQPTTAAQLAAMSFGDTNSSTSKIATEFKFDQTTLQTALSNAGLSAFVPGTIIVVKGSGLGGQDLNYAPTSANVGDTSAWSIQLVAGQGVHALAGPPGGTGNPGNVGDVVWVSSQSAPANNTDTSGFVSAIGYSTSPGLIANDVSSQLGSNNILRTAIPAGGVLENTGGSTVSLSTVSNSSVTLGAPNGGANTAWIVGQLQATSALSLAPEPGRVSLLLMGAWMFVGRRRRSGGGNV